MIALALSLALLSSDLSGTTASVAPSIQCPAYPEDPPWRPITCYILSRMGEPPTREFYK